MKNWMKQKLLPLGALRQLLYLLQGLFIEFWLHFSPSCQLFWDISHSDIDFLIRLWYDISYQYYMQGIRGR